MPVYIHRLHQASCYTNHALDQFLEHLLASGTPGIIRIGGQSQSNLLEDHNLRHISRTETKTRSEKYLLAKQYEALKHEEKRIKGDLGRIHGAQRREDWSSLHYDLLQKYTRVHAQLRQVDEEGYEVAGQPCFELWKPRGESLNIPESTDEAGVMVVSELDGILLKADTNVYSLSQKERRLLVRLWSQKVQDHALDDLFERVEQTESVQWQLTKIHDEVDRRVLQRADVIGMTTTGLAKRISTLKRVRCKVVICEEAGEVMEAHMMSALLPTIEHFIQIGDHEQLRPQINNFIGLSLESKQGALYQLDRSQFERLSAGVSGRQRMPVAQLNVQRRMRSEISKLVRETIYPKLEITRALPTFQTLSACEKISFGSTMITLKRAVTLRCIKSHIQTFGSWRWCMQSFVISSAKGCIAAARSLS